MSVVVAIKQDDRVYMAADTMVTFGNSKRYLRNDGVQKIWRVEDTPNCIMGGVGYLRDVSLVRYCTEQLVPELNILKGDINVGTLMNYLVPQICTVIAQYNEITHMDKQDDMSTSFVWAYKDRLFCILPDGEVEEFDDYVAIGSGADAAIASLESTIGEDIHSRLIKALNAAAETSLYVDAPYIAMDTDCCEYYELDYPLSDEECALELVEALMSLSKEQLTNVYNSAMQAMDEEAETQGSQDVKEDEESQDVKEDESQN